MPWMCLFHEVVIVQCSLFYHRSFSCLATYLSLLKFQKSDTSAMFMISSSLPSLVKQSIFDISIAGGFECHMCSTVLLGRLVGHLNPARSICRLVRSRRLWGAEMNMPQICIASAPSDSRCMYRSTFRRMKMQMTNLWMCILWHYQCGNFAASCDSISVTRSILAAKCKTKNGTPVSTSLDLNPHIGNDDGKLVAGGQNYIETCDPKGYGHESSKFLIFAQCKKKNGNAIDTSYNINKNVANIDGVLKWQNCNQLLANIVDEFAAVEEEIALNGRKLLNQ